MGEYAGLDKEQIVIHIVIQGGIYADKYKVG